MRAIVARLRAWLNREPYCLDCGGSGAVPSGGWGESDNGLAPCPSCANVYGK